MGNRDGNAVGGYKDECACMTAEVLAGKLVQLSIKCYQFQVSPVYVSATNRMLGERSSKGFGKKEKVGIRIIK